MIPIVTIKWSNDFDKLTMINAEMTKYSSSETSGEIRLPIY